MADLKELLSWGVGGWGIVAYSAALEGALL